MRSSIGAVFNNTYDVELIDSRTNEVKKSGSFHNIVTDKAYNMLIGYSSGTGTIGSGTRVPYDIFYRLRCGSGTNTPQASDTALSSPLWGSSAAFAVSTVTTSWVDDNTIKGIGVYEVPASESYVGTVTEIGLYCGTNSYSSSGTIVGDLCTHALLTDSEGQLISFEKTDIDILKITVTVEVALNVSDDNFKLFWRPRILQQFVGRSGGYHRYGTSSSSNYLYYAGVGPMYLSRYRRDNTSYTPSSTEYAGVPAAGTCSYDVPNRSTSMTKVRIPTTTVTTEDYFPYIDLSGLGYWQLPNENVLPAYTMSGITVGTGDGETVAFTCPVSYFKQGSDKVYKNGVQLTSGVDYTVSNTNNAGKLPVVNELRGDYVSSLTMDYTPGLSVSNNALLRYLLRPSDYNSWSSGATKCIRHNIPVFITYEEPVTINYFKAARLDEKSYDSSNLYNLYKNSTITLSYSLDGDTYEDAYVYTQDVSTALVSFDVSFDPVTAKYWKVTFMSGYSSSRELACPSTTSTSNDAYMYIGYTDPYITFTTAPAAGDVITMDVDMDVVFKNSNFVVDLEMEVDFDF